MQVVGKVAATMQQVFGPQLNELGQTTGAIQRVRKFTGTSLLQMLVLTLLRKPNAKIADFQSTAAQLGLDVTTTAIEHRFTAQLVTFLRSAVLEQIVTRAMRTHGSPSNLLKQFTSIRIGDSSTLAVPKELANKFPGCGGKSGSGQAGLETHLLWDFPHRLDSPTADYPGTPQRRDRSHRPGGTSERVAVVVRPGLLGFGAIRQDRRRPADFLDLKAAARDVGLRRHGPSLTLLQYLRQQTGPGPLDIVGFARRGTSSALPIESHCGCPKKWPTGGDRKSTGRPEQLAAALHRGTISNGKTRDDLRVTNCQAGCSLGKPWSCSTAQMVGGTSVQTLEIAQPPGDTPRPPPPPAEQMAMWYREVDRRSFAAFGSS